MEIKFSCSCGQRVAVDSAAGEQQFPCPCCGATLAVPEIMTTDRPSAMLESDEAPAQISQEFLRTVALVVLQAQGLVRKRIAKSTIERLPQRPWERICDDYPDLLTADGICRGAVQRRYSKRQLETAQMDFVSIAGERGADEEDATERQCNFMRSLGVRNEAMLSYLGKRQAAKFWRSFWRAGKKNSSRSRYFVSFGNLV